MVTLNPSKSHNSLKTTEVKSKSSWETLLFYSLNKKAELKLVESFFLLPA